MARPLVWAGNGIRLNGEFSKFRAFLDKHWIPFVTTWTGADLMPTDHLLNVGIVGVSGHVGANKAVHEADCILVRGSGTHTTQLGAKAPICPFYDLDYDQCPDVSSEWGERCQELKKEKVPLIGSYLFNDKMTRMLPPGANIVIDGGGTALYTGFQSSHVKEGTRLICSTAISAMGSGLPEAVGACLARDRRLTTCLIGDGSLMFNIQELSTIKKYNLPIKIFVLNNGGYLAIRHTQDSFLEGRHHGTGTEDLEIPKIQNVAACFGLKYVRLDPPYNDEFIGLVLDDGGPVLCEVMTPKDQKMVRAQMGKPLSEMVF